jgi:ribosome recycling factor
MAQWKIELSGKGLRKAAVEKLVKQLAPELGEGVLIRVTDNTPPESRADRFRAALAAVEDARSELESLRDELQEWYDNLPENFQQGDKGQQIEEAVSELEDAISAAEDLEGKDVTFPGMY